MLPKIARQNKNVSDEKNEIKLDENEELIYTPLTEEEIIAKICDTNSIIGNLTSETLLRTPKNFFLKYDKLIEQTLEGVRNTLSEDGSSDHLARLQADPTNLQLREKALNSITVALTKYNSSAKGQLLNREEKATENTNKIANVMVTNELIGLGPLEPLWNDTSITEIICNGPNDIQVEISGNIIKVPAIHFRSQDRLLDLINRLYNSINKNISRTNPMEKGRLHDKSRMMAVHQVVAPDGPNFNIRRHSDDYVTPDKIIKYGTSSQELMEDLGNLIYAGVSYLVVGGTGSGKTTLLDALTAYIRPNKRCVSLEENLEMKPHPRKLFAAAMEEIPPKIGSNNENGVTMRDLVRSSLQMRPETIFIGEVSNEAAYDLCQALNTGHDGASTLHANSPEDAMYRLMSLVSQSDLVKEHAAYDLISSAFDIIIYVERFPMDGSRKIVSVMEVADKAVTDDEGNKVLPVTPLWKFNPEIIMTEDEKPKVVGDWEKVGSLSDKTIKKHYLDIKPHLSWEELNEIAKL